MHPSLLSLWQILCLKKHVLFTDFLSCLYMELSVANLGLQCASVETGSLYPKEEVPPTGNLSGAGIQRVFSALYLLDSSGSPCEIGQHCFHSLQGKILKPTSNGSALHASAHSYTYWEPPHTTPSARNASLAERNQAKAYLILYFILRSLYEACLWHPRFPATSGIILPVLRQLGISLQLH